MIACRAALLAAALILAADCHIGAQDPASKPQPQAGRRAVVGAIRWDAWHSGRSPVGQAVERSLGPARWHSRLPFFARITDLDEVVIDGASQAVVDTEIEYARRARLDYWAFLLYQSGSAMNLPLGYYLASHRKRGLRFSLILEQAQWSTPEAAGRQFEQVAALMPREEYQSVAGNRPLIYVLAAEDEDSGWGSRHAREAFSQLRAASHGQSGRDPYIVVLDYRARRANDLRVQAGADAIGAYAYQRDGRDAPYSQLARETEQFWDECRHTGSAVTPLVMTGWDRRPRVERPVFWETWQKPGDGIEKFYRAPTAAELSEHLRNSLAWLERNGGAERAVLIYAWNENDEGGWLVPTLAEGAARIDAVREALRPGRRL